MMEKISGLTGQYVQVKREKSDIITYGGDQGFFAGAAVGSADERKQRLGCGIVALGDLFLYLADRHPCHQEGKSAWGEGGDLPGRIMGYVNRVLSQEEYMAYYNLIYDLVGGISPKARAGLSGIRLQRKFNRMARLAGWGLRAKWGISGKKIYGRIVEMLGQDIPAILCVPVMLRKKGQGLTFYKKEKGGLSRACMVSAHYVMVTGIYREREGVFLEISSWGKKYYVDWNEYDDMIHKHFLGTILGNVLFVYPN